MQTDVEIHTVDSLILRSMFWSRVLGSIEEGNFAISPSSESEQTNSSFERKKGSCGLKCVCECARLLGILNSSMTSWNSEKQGMVWAIFLFILSADSSRQAKIRKQRLTCSLRCEWCKHVSHGSMKRTFEEECCSVFLPYSFPFPLCKEVRQDRKHSHRQYNPCLVNNREGGPSPLPFWGYRGKKKQERTCIGKKCRLLRRPHSNTPVSSFSMRNYCLEATKAYTHDSKNDTANLMRTLAFSCTFSLQHFSGSDILLISSSYIMYWGCACELHR